ncbi:Nesprin-2 [Desmophyllum pertusum]|uniref:Nesprin-2 n=1 Tax=Desmophyllum pertusum TaxID=174260 RepID=A0A9X0CDS6_9CNID|nr:Nesprin-2 [Desmophyllum pertusum]
MTDTLFFLVFPQALEDELESQKAELDDLKEDMLKKNLDITSVEKTLAEAGVKLEEAIAPAPEMDVELEFVVEQFSGYIVAVQEWGAWFGPALATLERCKETYKNRSSLEDMNDQLQVLLDEMDKNDQLIGEVYNKGDVLLQVISGQSKATVESELNQLEENWAEFCQDTLSIKGVIEETIQMWNDFEENRDKTGRVARGAGARSHRSIHCTSEP